MVADLLPEIDLNQAVDEIFEFSRQLQQNSAADSAAGGGGGTAAAAAAAATGGASAAETDVPPHKRAAWVASSSYGRATIKLESIDVGHRRIPLDVADLTDPQQLQILMQHIRARIAALCNNVLERFGTVDGDGAGAAAPASAAAAPAAAAAGRRSLAAAGRGSLAAAVADVEAENGAEHTVKLAEALAALNMQFINGQDAGAPAEERRFRPEMVQIRAIMSGCIAVEVGAARSGDTAYDRALEDVMRSALANLNRLPPALVEKALLITVPTWTSEDAESVYSTDSYDELSLEDQLELAIEQDDCEWLQRLLTTHPQLRDTRIGAHGNLPLHHAAGFAQEPRIFELLFAAGCRLDCCNTDGCTPLHVAAAFRNAAAVRYFAQAKPELMPTLLPMLNVHSLAAADVARTTDNNPVLDELVKLKAEAVRLCSSCSNPVSVPASAPST